MLVAPWSVPPTVTPMFRVLVGMRHCSHFAQILATGQGDSKHFVQKWLAPCKKIGR